jgi:hypothetical protein
MAGKLRNSFIISRSHLKGGFFVFREVDYAIVPWLSYFVSGSNIVRLLVKPSRVPSTKHQQRRGNKLLSLSGYLDFFSDDTIIFYCWVDTNVLTNSLKLILYRHYRVSLDFAYNWLEGQTIHEQTIIQGLSS